MLGPDSTACADWPLQRRRLLSKFVLSGEVDGQNPPDSMVEAYLQVAEAQRRRLAGIPWGDGEQIPDEEDEHAAELGPQLAICARCGAGDLEHFYTCKRTGRTLCAACFEQRVEQGTVQKAAPAGS